MNSIDLHFNGMDMNTVHVTCVAVMTVRVIVVRHSGGPHTTQIPSRLPPICSSTTVCACRAVTRTDVHCSRVDPRTCTGGSGPGRHRRCVVCGMGYGTTHPIPAARCKLLVEFGTASKTTVLPLSHWSSLPAGMRGSKAIATFAFYIELLDEPCSIDLSGTHPTAGRVPDAGV